MSELLDKIRNLVRTGSIRISDHGYDELSDERIKVRDAVRGIRDAKVVEEYPSSGRGPAVLVLEYNEVGEPIHVVWGIPAGLDSPAVLVTAYRSDPEKWDERFIKR